MTGFFQYDMHRILEKYKNSLFTLQHFLANVSKKVRVRRENSNTFAGEKLDIKFFKGNNASELKRMQLIKPMLIKLNRHDI